MVALEKQIEIKIFKNSNTLFQAAADNFYQYATNVIAKKGILRVVLSGGTTPKFFFDALASKFDEIPWSKIYFFLADERYVPLDHKESNFQMAHQHLFSKISLPKENIFRIPTEYAQPEDAAFAYNHIIRKAFKVNDDELPLFDLVYLGLGDDAHTASLMPFSWVVRQYAEKNQLLTRMDPLVCSLKISQEKGYRITLTPKALNHSQCIIFLVTGENKAVAVQRVLEGPDDPIKWPGQLIHCTEGKTIWYLDQAAASQLTIY